MEVLALQRKLRKGEEKTAAGSLRGGAVENADAAHGENSSPPSEHVAGLQQEAGACPETYPPLLDTSLLI